MGRQMTVTFDGRHKLVLPPTEMTDIRGLFKLSPVGVASDPLTPVSGWAVMTADHLNPAAGLFDLFMVGRVADSFLTLLPSIYRNRTVLPVLIDGWFDRRKAGVLKEIRWDSANSKACLLFKC